MQWRVAHASIPELLARAAHRARSAAVPAHGSAEMIRNRNGAPPHWDGTPFRAWLSRSIRLGRWVYAQHLTLADQDALVGHVEVAVARDRDGRGCDEALPGYFGASTVEFDAGQRAGQAARQDTVGEHFENE